MEVAAGVTALSTTTNRCGPKPNFGRHLRSDMSKTNMEKKIEIILLAFMTNAHMAFDESEMPLILIVDDKILSKCISQPHFTPVLQTHSKPSLSDFSNLKTKN